MVFKLIKRCTVSARRFSSVSSSFVSVNSSSRCLSIQCSNTLVSRNFSEILFASLVVVVKLRTLKSHCPASYAMAEHTLCWLCIHRSVLIRFLRGSRLIILTKISWCRSKKQTSRRIWAGSECAVLLWSLVKQSRNYETFRTLSFVLSWFLVDKQ